MTRLFCFGLGYSAEALARRVRPLGWHVAGTARTAEGQARLTSLGYEAFVFDGATPGAGISDALADATHVLVSAGPDLDGDPTLRFHESDLARASNLGWIGYLSTIGVYGNTDGAWIDEAAAPNPGSERAKRRVAAENAWLAFGGAHGKRVQIFRLGGIYGPGRSALDDLRDGTARRIVKPGQVFNRIHVDDIAGSLLHLARGESGGVFNITDDMPSAPQDVIEFAADLMGIDPPPALDFETADLSPMARSFYGENKRVSNARIKAAGYAFVHANYRDALTAMWRDDRWR